MFLTLSALGYKNFGVHICIPDFNLTAMVKCHLFFISHTRQNFFKDK